MTTTKKKTVKREPSVTRRAKALVAGVTTLHDEALELAESVVFMSDKLKKARKEMAKEPLVIPYDNGGGQSGIRENPHYIAYEKLMATYTKSLRQLTEIVEKVPQTKTTSNIMAELSVIAGKKAG